MPLFWVDRHLVHDRGPSAGQQYHFPSTFQLCKNGQELLNSAAPRRQRSLWSYTPDVSMQPRQSGEVRESERSGRTLQPQAKSLTAVWAWPKPRAGFRNQASPDLRPTLGRHRQDICSPSFVWKGTWLRAIRRPTRLNKSFEFSWHISLEPLDSLSWH